MDYRVWVFAAAKTAHLSDDKAVAKMGHPAVRGANSGVKLWGNWAIKFAMGCGPLYNRTNPVKFRLVASLAERLER